ncbi:hypothetical protein CALVIDRAFT_536788 [Calocera viscosa TUFC12733]|uniref:Protein CPL1-like domain-containing protein n=1 Tax=Calocera viscosa (strain TUFC12733) TaxID=1330018 RepID=A0A167MMH1_CALVF|nr:hypothetical protein CALVIDRAFT_536788 [Calocera viscosa TUFC12733]
MRSLILNCIVASLIMHVSAEHGKAARALRRHARLPTITCPDGQYFNKSGCEPCLENYMCAFSEMYPCPAGTSSWAGASECTERGSYDAPSAGYSSSYSSGQSGSGMGQVDEEDPFDDYVDDGESEWPAHQGQRHRKDACFDLAEMQCPSPDGKGKICVDPMTNLESCGGCSISDEFGFAAGTDCTALEGALDVSCVKGNCLISSCKANYGVVQTSKGMQCVKDYDRLLAAAANQRGKMVVQTPRQK